MKWFSFLIIVFGSMFSLMSSNVIAEAVESTEIISISHSIESGDVENIDFVLAAEVEPRIFLLKGEKPRLVLDFINCHYKGKKLITLADGVLSTSIRSGIHQKPAVKTRIVIDLSREFPINFSQKFEVTNNTLTVKLERQMAAGAAEKVSVAGEASPKTVSQAELDARPLHKKPIPPVFLEKNESAIADTQEVAKAAESVTSAEPQAVADIIQEEKVESAVEGKEASPKPEPEAVVEEVKPSNVTDDLESMKRDVVPPVSAPVLRGLSFDDSSNRGEMVLFHLNDFFPPTVSAIEKDSPRVLCDFNNMRLGKDVQTPLVANGKYVERIRAANHKNPDKVRVVLDLAPDKDYDLQQVFFKNDNLFVLIVNELPAEKEIIQKP